MRTSLAEVAAATGGVLHGADGSFDRVAIDSRDAGPDALFVAIAGERTDGHDHAGSSGAAGVLASRPVCEPYVLVDDTTAALGRLAAWHRGRIGARVVGVTGSAGKTSTKDLLAAVLGEGGPVIAPPGSYNNDIGAPLTVLRADETTAHLVVEMGARARGDVARLAAMARPHTGVVLNVGAAHLGEFGSQQAIAVAKGELAEAATDLVVLNADDPLVAAMASRATAPVRTFGAAGDVRAERLEIDGRGRPAFTLVADEGTSPVRMLLVGAHQVGNALAAATVALAEGIPVGHVAAALNRATPASRWRMEITERVDGVTVVNDAYNANPDSMRAALDALASIGAARRVAVLGPMAELGDTAADEHARVAAYARSTVDTLVSVGAPDYGADLAFEDVDEVLGWLGATLRQGDVVLVKASRSAGLERVAQALVRQDQRT